MGLIVYTQVNILPYYVILIKVLEEKVINKVSLEDFHIKANIIKYMTGIVCLNKMTTYLAHWINSFVYTYVPFFDHCAKYVHFPFLDGL